MSEPITGPLEARDARALARLHRDAFPGFFLSQLGEPFLREFYRGFVNDPTAVSVVARDHLGEPLGAVVGTTRPEAFYRRLLRRRLPGLTLASLRAALRRPQAVGRLARGAGYRGQVGDGPAPGGALLSSICTSPSVRGTGIGARLLAEWETSARSAGARTAHLSTDADGNESVNAFYRTCGWRLEREYMTRQGRRMNLYTKDLTS